MDELKLEIALNSELYKDYFNSRDTYKEQMRYLDKSWLYLGGVMFVVSISLGFYDLDKKFVFVLLSFVGSVFCFWSYGKLHYLRWRWLKTVEITASIYKGVSKAQLVINESGVGLYYNDEVEFLYWNAIKQFEVKYGKFLLIYSSDREYLFVPFEGLSKLDVDNIKGVLTNKEIFERQKTPNTDL